MLTELHTTQTATPCEPTPLPLTPIVRPLAADLETPISAYLKLAGEYPSFLLESVTGGEHLGRYSFIGIDPLRAYILRGRQIEVRHRDGRITFIDTGVNPLDTLRAELAACQTTQLHGLPRFTGGLAGFLGYESMRFFEPKLALNPHPDFPDGIFLLADTLVAFDHAFGKMLLIATPFSDADGLIDPSASENRLDEIERLLANPHPTAKPPVETINDPTGFQSNQTRDQFKTSVSRAKEFIAAGDIFQVVLSQRLQRRTQADPFDIYRELRRLNPSPYMFFFDFKNLTSDEPLRLIGASPELHVRLDDRRATLRPIAGTRRRGTSPAEDTALESELLADPKERAEHVMLIDLARNDLGRVCTYGSVYVPEQMGIERYSHVMHIVSQTEGLLRPEYDAFDLLRATFPAGTVSGAPKLRAMQIIEAVEPGPRGPYAGVAGYLDAGGTMDTCITLRTLVMRGQEISIQAGAGIVADSDPESEYLETLNKARGLTQAVERAERM